jgi:hypothetical protein
MRLSKHYRPNSIYQDRAGTRYTVLYRPDVKCYCLYRLQPNGDRISNSGVHFSRWDHRELKYIGALPGTEASDEKV